MNNNNGQTKDKVNLLPEELRGKEAKEIAKNKKGRVVEIEMTDPKGGFAFGKEEKAQKGPGFWQSLFKAKPKKEIESGEDKKEFLLEKGADLFKEEKEEKGSKVKTKKKSWWSRLFGTNEERERRRAEKLALGRAKEDAMRRKKEAVKRIKLEKKLQRQKKDKDKVVVEEKVSGRKEKKEHRKRMRRLAARKKKEERERRKREKKEAALKKKEAREPFKEKPAFKPPLPQPLPAEEVKQPVKEVREPVREEKKEEEKDPGRTMAPKRESSGLEVNLIPEELLKRKELKLSRQILNLVFLVVACLLLIGSLYFGMVWYQSQTAAEIKVIDDKIEKINSEIAEYDQLKSKAIALQKKLKAIEDLFNQHLYWTEFFKLLGDYTIPDVYYSSFVADAGSGTVVMAATSHDYRSLAEQLVSFQEADSFIENVVINSASAQINPDEGDIESVLFNVSLKLQPKVFLKEISK